MTIVLILLILINTYIETSIVVKALLYTLSLLSFFVVFWLLFA